MDKDIKAMKASELRRERNRLRAALEEAERAVEDNPEVREASLALREANRRMSEVRKKVWDVVAAPFRNRLVLVGMRLRECQQQQQDETPEHIRNLLKRCSRGVDFGKPFKVRWVSATRRFFVVTVPGGTFWDGILNPRAYSRAKHYLVDCAKAKPDEYGYELWMGIQVRVVEGRLTAAAMKGFQEIASTGEQSRGLLDFVDGETRRSKVREGVQ